MVFYHPRVSSCSVNLVAVCLSGCIVLLSSSLLFVKMQFVVYLAIAMTKKWLLSTLQRRDLRRLSSIWLLLSFSCQLFGDFLIILRHFVYIER